MYMNTQVEEGDVVGRLLPGRVEVWKRKRDRRVEKRTRAREKQLKEWVGHNKCCCLFFFVVGNTAISLLLVLLVLSVFV